MAVLRGLHEAFGASGFEDIRRMTKGLSSDLVFRVVVQERPYLLRIMMRMDARRDPARIFACMKAAASAGLAPAVRYANTQDGIAILDFVEEAPLPRTEALVQIPRALRRLHALPRFPQEFNYVTAHKLFIWRFREAGLAGKDEVEEAFTRYERLCAVYPRIEADMVSCHMDLKPENILFDGRQVCLVDWEAGFVNDRYFDLGVAANFVVNDDAEEASYLEHYFGQAPDEYQRARFYLMRQVLHMFYAAVFMLLGSGGKPVSLSEEEPSFAEFHRRIWLGEIDLANPGSQIIYGTVHWRRLLQGIRGLRFDEAARIVSDRDQGRESSLLPRS